jgi:SAM-dependent methyltransferase
MDYTIMADDYQGLQGYNVDADLGLGCGLPTEFAMIEKGDVVVDLGSGAGNDCFVARAQTGESGKVIGIDMTEAMIEKARRNASKLGYENLEFILSDIEKINLPENTADVVVSNCVMNLVPDKQKAFAETYRIMKHGGHFSISDIVIEGELPEGLKNAAEMYAGCISGAMSKEDYLRVIRDAGFEEVTVQKSKPVSVPEDILANFLNGEELEAFNTNGPGIYSITVFARKPA